MSDVTTDRVGRDQFCRWDVVIPTSSEAETLTGVETVGRITRALFRLCGLGLEVDGLEINSA